MLHRTLSIFTLLVLGSLALLAPACGSDCPDNTADSGPALDQGPALDGRADLARKDASPSGGWAISAGESGIDGIWRLLVDASGNLVVSGFFSGTVSFGSTKLTSTGDTSTFVGKLDTAGKWLWAVRLDGVPTSKSGLWDGLAVDASGNIFYAGEYEGSATFGSTTLVSKGKADVFVAKLDSSGNVLWATSAGGTDADHALAVAVGSDGKITLAGFFSGTASFGSTSLTAKGKSDLYVARLEADGSFGWAVQAGSGSTDLDDIAGALVLDSSGNTYLGCSAGPSSTFGTLSLTGKTGQQTACVAKLDATAKFLWVWESPAATYVNSIARGPSGSLYITSNIAPTASPCTDGVCFVEVSKVSDNGGTVWSTMIAGDRTVAGNRLLVDDKGNVTLAGFFRGTALLGSTVITSKGSGVNGYLARLDSSGKVTGGEQISTTGWGSAIGLARDKSDNLYVAGIFNGTATFGGIALTSKGTGTNGDAYVWNTGQSK